MGPVGAKIGLDAALLVEKVLPPPVKTYFGLKIFEIGLLGLQALGMGLKTAFAPKQEFAPQPRETEQERAIKRRDDRRAEVRRYREEREQRGFNVNPRTGYRIPEEEDTRAAQAASVIRLLDGIRVGRSITDEARARQQLVENQNRPKTDIIQPQMEDA